MKQINLLGRLRWNDGERHRLRDVNDINDDSGNDVNDINDNDDDVTDEHDFEAQKRQKEFGSFWGSDRFGKSKFLENISVENVAASLHCV